MKKVGIALLGVGRWGINLLRNLLQHPQASIIAVVDPSQERLDYCIEHFKLNSSQVAIHWQLAREKEPIEAVVIATPAYTHYELILDALNLGYHVLAEKPLTLNPQECLILTKLAAAKKLQLFVDHTYLFNSVIIKGKEVIQSGKLGVLRYGYASRTHLGPIRQDVNVLWDLAIHDIAIFNYWLGQKPVTVQAHGKIWLQENLADLVWLTLTYPDGFEANIHLCWLNTDKQRRLSIVGNQGSLIFDEMSIDSPLTLQQGTFEIQGSKYIPINQATHTINTHKSEPLKTVCDRFINSIGIEIINHGEIATELVNILCCLTKSLQQQGKIITVDYRGGVNS